MWFSELERLCIAFFGKAVYPWSAGVGQSHDFRAFIECFACRIINGLSDDLHGVMVFHQYDLTISPTYQ